MSGRRWWCSRRSGSRKRPRPRQAGLHPHRGTCSHVGRAEWLHRGRRLHGGRRLLLDAHFRSDDRRRGPGVGLHQPRWQGNGRNGHRPEQDSASGQLGGWTVVAHARPARPECRPVSAIFERCHGDEWRRARGGGLRLVRHGPGQSTGYVLLPTQTGDYRRAHAVSADGRVVVGIDAALTGLWRAVKSHQFELTAGVVVSF
jgi:hypothetical protein